MLAKARTDTSASDFALDFQSESPKSDHQFDDVWMRIQQATGLKTQTELAKSLGIRPQTVSGAKSRGVFPIEWAYSVAKRFNISLEWMLDGEGPMYREGMEGREGGAGGQGSGAAPAARGGGEAAAPAGVQVGPLAEPDEFAYLPLYAVTASAGAGRENGQARVDRVLAFRRDWIHRELHASPADLYLLYVAGDSMEPTLTEGDIVLLQRLRSVPMRDGIHVLRMGDALHIKRVQFLPGGRANVTSDNPAYAPFTLDMADLGDDTEIVGRILWCGKRM